MNSRPIAALALLIVSLAYWQCVCALGGASEPWDAAAYWRLWYPASLLLAALAGWRMGWTAGAIVVLAQAPVLWLNTGIGALWLVGTVMLVVLALPAIAVAAAARAIARHRRSAR